MRGIEACLEGRLAADPELRHGKESGKPWLRCNVACGDGDQVQRVKVAIFAKAEELAKVLSKGSVAYFEGSLKVETWQDQ
jgi:single-stranded DNA-binding protein